MTLYLSATSIKDFIDCSKRFYYKQKSSADGIINPDMLVGTIVHDAIDKYRAFDFDVAKDYFYTRMDEFSPEEKYYTKGLTCLDNYHAKFKNLFKDGESELKFSVPFNNNTKIVGRMDFINKNTGLIIDWKTSAKTPSRVDNDIQFIIYDYAFTSMYRKKAISIFYVNLLNGDMVNYKRDALKYNLLFKDIIPAMLHTIKAKNFSRTGLFKGQSKASLCYSCPFAEICEEEGGQYIE
jgi:CRISPR/Cas system-associated exonuclease Cas4 (RecB family)